MRSWLKWPAKQRLQQLQTRHPLPCPGLSVQPQAASQSRPRPRKDASPESSRWVSALETRWPHQRPQISRRAVSRMTPPCRQLGRASASAAPQLEAKPVRSQQAAAAAAQIQTAQTQDQAMTRAKRSRSPSRRRQSGLAVRSVRATPKRHRHQKRHTVRSSMPRQEIHPC